MVHRWQRSMAFVLALASVAAVTAAPVAAAGRWKKENGKCVWDAKDSGPDQCKPPAGRFKKEGDNCVWDGQDDGADQCTPKKGRFKKNGDNCVWDANDSGPNQCRPTPQRR